MDTKYDYLTKTQSNTLGLVTEQKYQKHLYGKGDGYFKKNC